MSYPNLSSTSIRRRTVDVLQVRSLHEFELVHIIDLKITDHTVKYILNLQVELSTHKQIQR
jgi:rhodanese-related sulfurtransferase